MLADYNTSCIICLCIEGYERKEKKVKIFLNETYDKRMLLGLFFNFCYNFLLTLFSLSDKTFLQEDFRRLICSVKKEINLFPRISL